MNRSLALVLLLAAFCAAPFARAETFRNPYRIPTPVDPASVAAGDLNGDGIADLVWGDSTHSVTLHVLLSQPGGGWIPGADIPYPIATTRPPVCLFADFNGDGRQDLVCASAYEFTMYLHVFLGNGDGTLQTPIATPLTSIHLSGWAAQAISPVGDLNHDGFPDLYLIDAESQLAFTLLSDGKGGFKPPISAPNGINGMLPVAADVNGDGIPDLLFPQGPEVALGKGDGSFQPANSYAQDSYYNAICTFHDMDGDGHLDADCGYEEAYDINGASDLIILHGNPDGSFNTTPIARKVFGDHDAPTDGYGAFQTPLTVSDLNGDGILDIVAQAGDGITVLLGGPHLTYGAPLHYAEATVTFQQVGAIYESLVVDVNGDGIPDVVETGTHGIYISYGRRDGSYSSAFAPEVAEALTYSTVADFNGDGIPDVVAAGDTALKLSLGKGDGTFSTPVALSNNGAINYSVAGLSDVLHGDFNGDGRQDLFAAGQFVDSLGNTALGFFIYFGNGDGSFQAPVLVNPNPDFIFDASALNNTGVWDINNDGMTDLFVVYVDAIGGTGIFQSDLSNGDGSFKLISTAVPLDPSKALSIPAIADFNGDGKLDAVYGSTSNAYFVKGHGDGTFDSTAGLMPISLLAGMASQGALSAAAGDFDGDGLQDFVLLVNYSVGADQYFPHPAATAAWVYYGHGDGTFSAPVLAGVFDHNYALVSAADLNKDGLADIVLRTYASSYGEYAVGVVNSLPARTFAPEVNYTAGIGLSNLAITDLNNDGFPDLVFDNSGASSVTVLLNQGNTPTVSGTLTATPEPSFYSQLFVLTAALTTSAAAVLTGNVTFSIDGKPAGEAALANNTAVLPYNGVLPIGPHSLTAEWAGSATYPSIILTGSHVVSGFATSIDLSSSLNPSRFDDLVTFTAAATSASGAPTGSIIFTDATTTLATVPLINGVAALSTRTLLVGAHPIIATYIPSGNFAASSASLTQIVTLGVAGLSIADDPTQAYADQPVKLTSVLLNVNENPPLGTVSFYDGAALIAASAIPVNEEISISTSFATPGLHSITAVYSGDSKYSPATSPTLVLPILINASSTTVASLTNPALAYRAITLVATVTSSTLPQSSPQGIVRFFAGTTDLGSATLISGSATLTTSSLAAGTYSVTAVYSGSPAFVPSASPPFSLVVGRAPAAILISSSENPAIVGSSITFTSTVSGPPAPTASVSFADNGKPLAAPVQVNAQGIATLTTNALPLGTHAITAAYPGDANLVPITSPPLQQAIVLYTGDFSIQASPASASFYTGESATFHVAVSPINGFNYPLSLACGGLPANTTCAFTPASLPTGQGEAALVLQSTAPQQVAANSSRPSLWKPVFSTACLVALLWIPGRTRRRFYGKWLSICLLSVTALASIGCANNHPIAGGTPPGTYTITITAATNGTGPSRSHSANVTVLVKTLF